MSTEAKQEVDHARANAAGWLESIREMVAKLDKEQAAGLFAESLDKGDCIRLLDYDESDWEACEDSVENMRELLVERLTDGQIETDEFEFDEDSARQTIEESVLEVTVRSDWYSPGTSADDDARKPAEFRILLTFGGPALQLIGDLDDHGQSSSPRLEYQDWGTPWTEYRTSSDDDAVLLEFANVFYFGE